MTSSQGPTHVVVDGSNIATEGRSLPSLAQLSEAVMAFMEDYPDTSITVVVDATFGHRIDKSEVKEFEEGIANNELVAPPAGAVGRGDAFVLSIAQKAHSSILSNDSFQEFHGDYDWLFDEGRLIGGKPVPHVGWVFVDRTPVRGPVSRKATGAKGGGRRGSSSKGETSKRGARKTSAEAMEPMPIPKSPPPRRAVEAPMAADADATPHEAPSKSRSNGDRESSGRSKSNRESSGRTKADRETSGRNNGDHEKASPPKSGEAVNDLMPFLEFVEHHPVGTSINGTVDSYSSHGAYVAIGETGVRGYVPLRLMADPAPTSARKVMKLGDSVTLVVVSFAPVRRSIDCAIPDMAAAAIADARAEQDDDTDAVIEAAEVAAAEEAPAELPTATKTPAKKAPAKKVAAKKVPAKKVPAKKAPVKKAPAKKVAAKKAPVKKVAAKKAPAKVVATKSTSPDKAVSAKQTAPAPSKATPRKAAPAKKAAATAAEAKKTAAKQTPIKKATPPKQAAPAKAPVEKAEPAKKASAVKPPAKKVAAAKLPAPTSPAKKSAAKKSAAKKAAAKKAAPAKKVAAKKAAVASENNAPTRRRD